MTSGGRDAEMEDAMAARSGVAAKERQILTRLRSESRVPIHAVTPSSKKTDGHFLCSFIPGLRFCHFHLSNRTRGFT